MNIVMPVTEWFSYTADRHICAFDWNWTPGMQTPEVHPVSHRVSSADALWADIGARNLSITEIVCSYVEAARVAFNAGTVEVAKDNATLVPVSSKLYLDGAIIYTLAERFKLYVVLPYSNADCMGNTGTITYLSALFHDDWLDTMVYLRSIRALYKTEYTVEQGAVESTTGTPCYIGRVPKARAL
jgi:hypothetical protein